MIGYSAYEITTVITFWQIAQIAFISLFYLCTCQKVFTLDS